MPLNLLVIYKNLQQSICGVSHASPYRSANLTVLAANIYQRIISLLIWQLELFSMLVFFISEEQESFKDILPLDQGGG